MISSLVLGKFIYLKKYHDFTEIKQPFTQEKLSFLITIYIAQAQILKALKSIIKRLVY